jgi:hypothetical protein
MNHRLPAIVLTIAILTAVLAAFLAIAVAPSPARAETQEDYASWPLLRPTFPSTGGNGIMIKGYDPVIAGGKCITTFMAVTSDAEPKVYANVIEFEAVAVQGGTLCHNGRWRAFEGGASGTTPFRVFFKDGVFRGSP